MSLAIIIVVIAQFLNAIVALIDKYIVSTKKVPNPLYYAFFVSILSALSVFVFFFSFIPIPIPELSIPSVKNIAFPTTTVLMLSIASGASLFFALWSLFTALRGTDASDVIPVVGSTSALFAIPMGFYILGTRLSGPFFIGIILLTLGSLILSHYRFRKGVLLVTVMSGLFFAIHFISLKLLFGVTSFDNAFFWSRMGIVVVAVILFIPGWSFCRECYVGTSGKSNTLIIFNKIMAGVAGFLLLKAVDLSNVALVQALGGIQFVFLLIISLTVGRFLPPACGENQIGRNKKQKTIAISIIVIGFLFLFL